MPELSDRLAASMLGRGFITVTEAAVRADVGERTIRNWIKNEKVQTTHHGGFVFMSVESLEAFLPHLSSERT